MEYRTFVPGADDAAVLKLRANVWGAEHPHTTPEFLHWLLGDTPAGAGSGVLMVDGQEVVGFAGLLPRHVEIESESLAVAQCVDYMVHTEARSRAGSFRIVSIWTRLARDLGFAFGIGFPNASSHKIGIRLGWRDAFWPDLMVRPLSRAAVPDFLARWAPARLLGYGAGVMARLATARVGWSLRHRPPGEAFVIDRFDSRFDLLWQRVRTGSLSGMRRDAAYLNWRYRLHPCYSYLRIGWEHDGELLGFAIASPRTVFDVPSMLVVDLLVAPSAAPNVADVLLEQVIDRAEEQGSHLVEALANDHSATRTALKRMGLVTVPNWLNPKPIVMTVHDLGVPGALPSRLSKWHFGWGDTDVV